MRFDNFKGFLTFLDQIIKIAANCALSRSSLIELIKFKLPIVFQI